jgi:DNA polymerase II small subunit/DNA polymerase delta subunit B
MPNVEILGHMHSCLYAVIQGVHCFEAMTFQSETNFTKSKGLQTTIGGWIVEYEKNDVVLKMKPECITF